MSNMYGRKVVAYKVNKSGGSVVAGDVVIIDTSNDNAFTTTTSAAVTTGAWIADETIASNATGRVVLSGHVTLVNVSASVTRGHTGTTHTVAKQAVSTGGTTRTAGTFCKFTTGGTTPEADIWPVDLGGGSGELVASSTLWDAAGDLAVGSGADTATKLTLGSVGSALARINGAVAWNGGTSFPGSKATGDRFYRSDLGMEFYWDGTRWVSVQLFAMEATTGDSEYASNPADAIIRRMVPVSLGTRDIWLVDFRAWVTTGGPNDGSNYYTYTIFDHASTDLGHFNTSGDTAGTGYSKNVSLGVVHDATTAGHFLFLYRAKTGSVGTWRITAVVTYRVIAT